MTGLVQLTRYGATAVVALNDPSRRNILSARLVHDIGVVFDELEADESVVCAVVTGVGPAFCAGAELATLEHAVGGDFDLIRQVYGGFLRILDSPLLTVAAVNGPAVGAGFNVALACDLRLASTSARFVSRFAELRIFPGGGHTWMLHRAVGAQHTFRSTVLGQEWDSEEALRIGLVVAVSAPEDLLEETLAVTSSLSRLDPDYVRRLVATIRANAVEGTTHLDALEREAEHQRWSTGQPAFRAGLERIRSAVQQR